MKKVLIIITVLVILMYAIGCGSTAREICKAAPKVLSGVLEDTGRICSNGAKALAAPGVGDGLDSMALDGMDVPSFGEAQAMAATQGWRLSQ